MVKAISQSIKPIKITELPCTTHLKPLRHVEKFVKTGKDPVIKAHTLWNKTLEKFKYQEEQYNVRSLENWEKNTLKKQKNEEELRNRLFKSRLS